MVVDLREYIDLEVVFIYIKCLVILMVKMMLMSLLTGVYRMKKKAFANPEDASIYGKGDQAKKYVRADPDVERIRRIHLNDLENIIPFGVIGLFYSLSGASYSTAWWLYHLFLGSRLLHTVVYFVGLPPPCRALAWGVGYSVTFFMVYKLLLVGLSM